MPGLTDPAEQPVDDRPLMTPAALLGDRVKPLPERVVLVFDDSHVPRRGRRRKPAPFRQVALRQGAAIPVAVVAGAGPGAPTAAVTVEFLHHLGVRSLIAVGLAGTLDDRIKPGAIRSVGGAISQEGTSAGYGSHLLPDQNLTDRLTAETGADSVTTVSTDTPLIHTATDLVRFRKSAEVMEMEMAALFSATNHCGIAAASLVVISDRYSGDSWSLADPEESRRTIDTAMTMAMAVLAGFDHDCEVDQ